MSARANVLVVEDDEDLRHLVAVVLAGEGFSVWTAANGHAALAEIAERGMPDLILLDMRMPTMNGPEFARALAARYAARAPILVMTAAADPRASAAQIDAIGWLAKPFEIEALIADVRGALGRAIVGT